VLTLINPENSLSEAGWKSDEPCTDTYDRHLYIQITNGVEATLPEKCGSLPASAVASWSTPPLVVTISELGWKERKGWRRGCFEFQTIRMVGYAAGMHARPGGTRRTNQPTNGKATRRTDGEVRCRVPDPPGGAPATSGDAARLFGGLARTVA
jgi:hypothetical protein